MKRSEVPTPAYVIDEKKLKHNVSILAEVEEKARRLDEKLKADLEYYYDKLTGLLKTGKIKDPDIWTHQKEKSLLPHYNRQ